MKLSDHLYSRFVEVKVKRFMTRCFSLFVCWGKIWTGRLTQSFFKRPTLIFVSLLSTVSWTDWGIQNICWYLFITLFAVFVFRILTISLVKPRKKWGEIAIFSLTLLNWGLKLPFGIRFFRFIRNLTPANCKKNLYFQSTKTPFKNYFA